MAKKNQFASIFLGLILLSSCLELDAYQKNEISFGTGGAYNAYTSIEIRQPPNATDRIQNHCETKPFEGSPYYGVSYTRWVSETFGLGAELIHHKIYLVQKPSWVQKFTITNGYNLLMVNQVFQFLNYRWFDMSFVLGEGIVVSHPESVIRGERFDESGGLHLFDTDGYFVSELVLQTSFKGVFKPTKYVGILFDGKATYSFASVPVYQGFADIVNIAFHGIGGLSISF